MSSASIAETKNSLSSILAAIAAGTEREHIIKNRDLPVAVIIPYAPQKGMSRKFGYAANDGKSVDWDAFDSMDSEIAEMFGV